jgi:vacuolar-type H+-ATPase subunit D/Vma8
VWIALFAAYRLRTLQQRIEVLEDRLERTSRRADALEDETRRRRGTPTL